jgi:cytochrome b561
MGTKIMAGTEAPGERYTRIAIVLHWAIAAFIIFNLCTGLFMENWPLSIRFTAIMLHASSGLTVLALTVVRIVWRLFNEPPPFPAGMKPSERHAAHVVHFLLYAAMVLMPISGWAILSAHSPPGSRGEAAAVTTRPALPPGIKPEDAPPGPTSKWPVGGPQIMKFWNVVPMPAIAPIEAIGAEPGGVAPQHKLHEEFAKWHSIGAYLLIGLLLLHIAGALKHQFIDRQSEFARMGIGRKR